MQRTKRLESGIAAKRQSDNRARHDAATQPPLAPPKGQINMKNLRAAIAALIVSTLCFPLVPANAASCGGASWYALTSRTASGERMNPAAMTAAHRSLPFGSKLRVTNPKNGKAVIVRINDRGPFIKGRVLDLSKGAAGKLGYLGAGHARLCFERI